MLIHDDIFAWEGFGGVFHLAAGQCWLRLYDLSRGARPNVAMIRPIVAVVSDLPDEGTPNIKKVTVRSCASHIATMVAQRFKIDPHRMTYVEYYPASTYGEHNQHVIEARYEKVDFSWHGDKALHPKWRPLPQPLLAMVVGLLTESGGPPRV